MLTPDRFLQDIPLRITAEKFYSWAEADLNQQLRDDLNYDLADRLSQADRASEGEGGVPLPEAALGYVHEVAEETEAVPYNAATDPRGLIGWHEVGQAAARAEAAKAPVAEPSQDDFFDWLGTLVDRFQHAVENTDLWRALWNDELADRESRRSSRPFPVACGLQCASLPTLTSPREANAGRGPVDFKFSAGWRRRALDRSEASF